MLRSRFLWKLYAGYASVILLSSLFVGGMVAERVESETLAELDRRLSTIAIAMKEPTGDYFRAGGPTTGPVEDDNQPTKALQTKVRSIGNEIQIRLTVVRVDGVVIADSENLPSRMENHRDRPEIIQAYAEGTGSASRFSKTLGQELYYFAVPLIIDGQPVASIRSSLPFIDLEDRLDELRRAVFLGALLATFAALLIGFIAARRVTLPVLSMAKAAEEIAGGAYVQRIHNPSRDELGTLARAFNTMNQELQSSMSALDTDRNKLTAILASMEEGVVAVDRDERIVHINEAAAGLLRVESEHVEGRPVWEIMGLRQVSEVLGEVLTTSRNVHRVIHLSGSPERVIELRATLLGSENGLSGAVLILDDVSRLRHLETMRRDFIANVSHELKTPITVIRGMIETMLDDPDIEPDRRERFLQRVLLQADRMGNLVTDLLSLAHLESADALSDPVPLDLVDSIKQTIRVLQPMAEAKSVQIDAILPDFSVMAIGDEEFLGQAIANLLNNAIKFSPAGERIEARLAVEEKTATIEIEDHGIGIEARHRERLFERFYRVDTARSRKLGGTGLGLAIVKHITLSMGGEVSVDSTPGSGSIFRMRLPTISPAEDTEPKAKTFSPLT